MVAHSVGETDALHCYKYGSKIITNCSMRLFAKYW